MVEYCNQQLEARHALDFETDGLVVKVNTFAQREQLGATSKAPRWVIASGARYRRPDIPNLATFEGAGISYWASPIEAKLCEGEEIALVGGGNSAGQAALFLQEAERVERQQAAVPLRAGEGLVAAPFRRKIA